jgi:DNA-binding GntR family transcriptional regulator
VRRSLHGEMVEHLRDMILSGELVPGEKISEQQLCSRFGVSRTPLREALKVLAAEGLIELLPNRGAVVARITEKEIEDLFPIIGALEGLAGEQICDHADDAGLDELRTLHDRLVDAYQQGDELAYLRFNRLFHLRLMELSQNQALVGLYHQLLARIHVARFIIRKTPETWRLAVEEHQQIIAALERRDRTEAGALLRHHMTVTGARTAYESLRTQ